MWKFFKDNIIPLSLVASLFAVMLLTKDAYALQRSMGMPGYDQIVQALGFSPVNPSSLSSVATSGNYNDLANKPSIPAAQVQSDWGQASSGAMDFIKNKPTMGQCYEGTTSRSGCMPIFKTATIAGGSGAAAFHLTADGTSGGTTICPNGVIDASVRFYVNDTGYPYAFSHAWSNANKTLTATVFRTSGLVDVLGISVLRALAAAPNGVSVNLTAWCY